MGPVLSHSPQASTFMMSTSPILNLDNDTLLTILDTITQRIPHTTVREDGRPLTTVRAASQVCPRWRKLLLASPWIWGRVIDLHSNINDDHGPRRIEWMEEVVRRAGSAPLWISGIINDIDPMNSRLFDKKSYFIRLLEYWERIEQLSVVIYGEIPDSIQSRFLSPAPSLKLFNVDLPEPLFLHTLPPGSPQCLFADHAPLLLAIKADVAFKSDSSWLHNIRKINFISCRITGNSFMVLLQHTPFIESITLDTTAHQFGNIDQTHSSVPKPNLPKLSSIRMVTTLAVGARILDYVSPGKLSALHISIFNHIPRPEDSLILPSFKKNLSFYISNYFSWNQLASTAVLLSINNSRFQVSDDLIVKSIFDDLQGFDILMNSNNQLNNDDVIACLLDVFTLGCTLGGNPYKSITKMRLKFNKVQPTLIPNIYSMLANFHHVQEIETEDIFTQTLLAISYLDGIAKDADGLATEQGGSVLFPELRTLHMNLLYSDDGHILCTYLPLFIIQRKKIGFPVAKLDLTNCRRSNYTRDLRALEEVDGLEVVWKELGHEAGKFDEICTYTCGTGDPERLIIDLHS